MTQQIETLNLVRVKSLMRQFTEIFAIGNRQPGL